MNYFDIDLIIWLRKECMLIFKNHIYNLDISLFWTKYSLFKLNDICEYKLRHWAKIHGIIIKEKNLNFENKWLNYFNIDFS